MSLFKNANFRSGVLLMAALGAMLYGLIFVLPVFISSVLGFTAQQVGEQLIPGALASAFMMPLIGGSAAQRARSPHPHPHRHQRAGLRAALASRSFNSDSSMRSMFWPLLLRGAAMAYLFVPINTAVLTQFQGAAIGEAAGLLNLCRQLGGSIAIAMLSTLMAQFQDHAYVSLKSHVTGLDPVAWAQYYSAQALAYTKLAAEVGIGGKALLATKLLYFRVKRQSFVLAFHKTLYIVIIMFSLALIPLRSLKPKRMVPGAKLPDAH